MDMLPEADLGFCQRRGLLGQVSFQVFDKGVVDQATCYSTFLKEGDGSFIFLMGCTIKEKRGK